MARAAGDPGAAEDAVAVLGLGRAGRDLLHLLARAGVPVGLAWSRGDGPARIAGLDVTRGALPDVPCRRVVLAVDDRAIAPFAAALVASGRLRHPEPVLLHLSGALPAAVLGDGTHPRGAMHPLQTLLGDGLAPTPFPWALEGDAPAVAAAAALVDALGCPRVELPSAGKARYHAAATLASSGLVAVLDLAAEQMRRAGIDADALPSLLVPLMRTTLANAGVHGTAAALTGPVARADVDAVRAHLAALGGHPDDQRCYRALSARLVALARDAAGDRPPFDELERLLATPACPQPDDD